MRLGSLHLCVSEVLSVHVNRYFGSAEGSKFVEMVSVDNVKRTWVNYGVAREWSDPTQGQVGGGEGVWYVTINSMHENSVVFESSRSERMTSSTLPSPPHRVRSFSTMLLR